MKHVAHGCVIPQPVGGGDSFSQLLSGARFPIWVFLSCPLVHLVDIWNVIEALRENALNNLDPSIELNVARLEAVISTIFYQLNKRMPTTHQINVEQSISLLLNFLLAAFDPWVCLSSRLSQLLEGFDFLQKYLSKSIEQAQFCPK